MSTLQSTSTSNSTAPSELFTQLQRLSSLQSLIKLLEQEQGPAPEDQPEGYLDVAKCLLDCYEKSCRILKYFNIINHRDGGAPSSSSSSSTSGQNQHRALFSAIFNKSDNEDDADSEDPINSIVKMEEEIFSNETTDNNNADNIALELFGEHADPQLLHRLHEARERRQQRLVELDDDATIDDEPLLPFDTEDHIFDLLASKLGGSFATPKSAATSNAAKLPPPSVTTVDMIMKKALQRGIHAMINKQAEEQVTKQLEERDRKLAEERRKTEEFNRNLILKGTSSTSNNKNNVNNNASSSSSSNILFDDGLGINIDEEGAAYDDDDNDGGRESENGNRNKVSDQVEIERLDMEPRFLKSMGVNFRARIEEARRSRFLQELEQKKLKMQAKRTGISQAELKESKEKNLIDRQQQKLEKGQVQQQQQNHHQSENTNNMKTADMNSMQLALKKRAQVLKEQRTGEAKYLLNNNQQQVEGNKVLATDAGETNEMKRQREFGESANADDSGSSLHLTLQKLKQNNINNISGQNNNNNNNNNQHQQQPSYRFDPGLLPLPGTVPNLASSTDNNNNFHQPEPPQNQQQAVPGGWFSDNNNSNVKSKNSAFDEIQRQRASLPIAPYQEEIIRVIRSQRTNVIIAETGSGKTTQLARYLYDAGFCKIAASNSNNNNQNDEGENNAGNNNMRKNNSRNRQKLIACTQPRLIAAKTVAARVADEFGCQVGEQVGYTVRFDDCTSPLTVIKYMTDGVLLREALMDDAFSRYSVIILDEAHERNLNTDILFALCKKAILKNPDLTIVATSATLDSDKFCEYFGCEHKLEIPGRTFPVEKIWLPKPCEDYFEEAIETVMKIHILEKLGDILVFLTGKEEIETAKKRLDRYMESEELRGKALPLIVTRLYAGLPDEDKAKALERTPPECRKVILSTNIAETSVTIDGLYYVVDSGYHKQNVYNPGTGVETLAVVPIARSQSKQRAGRAGRTGPGKAYFLYTEQQFWSDMAATSVPEIQRTNLANVVLTLKAIGFNNILSLDFMDPPPVDSLVNALEHLYFLSALDQDGVLTSLGGRMSQLPVSPNESRSILTALELGCLDAMLTIVAMLGEQHIFARPKERQEEADRARLGFAAAEGDHITLLRVWEACADQQFSTAWMKLNFINPNAISRCRELRGQLMNLLQKNLNRDREVQMLLEKNNNANNNNNNNSSNSVHRTFNTKFDLVKVRKSIIAGYFYHAARRNPNQPTEYSSLTDKRTVHMNPSCVLFHARPKFVVYHELLETTREYMRECISVQPAWLLEMAPNFFSSPGAGKKTEDMKRQRIDPILRSWESHGSGANTWRISKMKPPRTK